MTVGERIRNRRQELHLSQAELSKKVGYKDKTPISKIENAGDDITMKKISRIAPALDCTPAFLLGWESSPEAQKTIDHISSTLESIGSAQNEFFLKYKDDSAFMHNIELLWSLPDEDKRSIYRTIQGLYYSKEIEIREKESALRA